MTEERPVGRERRPDLLARVQDAIPLLVLYFGFAALYAWQASRHPVPTIFTDELEMTQLARSIAETGEAARRGVPYGMPSLAAYVLAPVWWLGSASSAYAAGKLVLVLAMSATLFPTYGLARMVVPRWYALGAAGAAVAVPALAYSPILVEEPLAYPLSTLALWLIARLLAQPSSRRLAAAVAVSAAAALTRTQLAVLFAVLALGLLWLGWESEPVRRWRAGWSGWDWAGAITLAVGAMLAFSATMSSLSTAWRNTTLAYKGRIFDHASWAVGALAIGIGVLPLLIGMAALARPKDEPRDPKTRAFVVTSAAAIGGFVWYAGIKGAYLSTVFSTVVVERNVIYLGPILFAATALAFARGLGRGWAIAAAAGLTLFVVHATPLRLDQYPYYEAHGLAIATFANRELGWPEGTIERALLLTCSIGIVVVVALRLVRRGSIGFAAIAGTAAVLVVGWSMTAEVYAAQGERILSNDVEEHLARPFDWVDRATGQGSVVVLGQEIRDPTGIWLTEFFNRGIQKMWSLDGTAINVGSPILTPDLDATDGTLTPSPGTDYALTVNGIALQAPIVDRRGSTILYRIDGAPLKLKDAVIGRQSDNWIVGENGARVARASYTRYDVSDDGPGFAVVKLSRSDWCPRPGLRNKARAIVRIGPVGIGPDKQPTIARVTARRAFVVKDCTASGAALRAPNVPWRLEVTVAPTFSPSAIDPRRSDRRQLGATFAVSFQPLFG